tara:strand:+ start:620 stop:832 length:213 start_codon:yes stop_codon:yes gene_type:complete
MTLAIPEDMKKELDEFPEMNWSEVARAAMRKRLEFLKQIKEFTKDSEMTMEDAIELGRKVNKGLARRYRK